MFLASTFRTLFLLPTNEMSLFLGIDVGTSSARAGIFDEKGILISSSSAAIKIDNPRPGFYQQSSNDIWKSVSVATREAIRKASEIIPNTTTCCIPNLSSESVAARIMGVGVDATCSLVLLNDQLEPVSLNERGGEGGIDDFNIIMWMDHRAEKQAQDLSVSPHPVLETTGGKISPEMSVAKVCWIYQQRKDLFDSTAHLIELPEFLVFKLTGSLTRSLNSLVCKWGYAGMKEKWNDSFWCRVIHQTDLNTLYEKCGGEEVVEPGACIPSGLTLQAADELGLTKGTAVAGSIIDAYAGVLATIGMKCSTTEDLETTMEKRMAIIAGTSSCHILVRNQPLICKGVWGPYADVLLAGKICMEGGQSLTGKALELIMERHPAWISFSSAYPSMSDAFEALNSLCIPLKSIMYSQVKQDAILQTSNVHVLPDLHGNRSPIADASIRGTIVGLDADTSLKSLQTLYLSTLLALCYGTLHIIDSLKVDIQELVLCGGMASNYLLMQLLSDVTSRPVLVTKYDAVLCGSAILGFAASKGGAGALQRGMVSMSDFEREYRPDLELADFHARKFAVFKEMYLDFFKYQRMMDLSNKS